MIDHFALAFGHGLLAIAMLRLVMRAGLDADPLIGEIAAETISKRKVTNASGRSAARRARHGVGDAADPAPGNAAAEPAEPRA
ncbi:MAG: hypothetical protein O9293_02530 [Porphyrobacter sp.]|nr:hypothetical protein [Porphyrobacter sp.]